MNKLKNWIKVKLFELKTGAKLEIANNGNPVNEIIIRHNQYFLSIMFDAETGEPTGDFGWSEDPGVFNVPIQEHHIAVRQYKDEK